MLYDPKWERKTKAPAFSTEGLIAWLETMPADGTYCFTNLDNCLLTQYFKSRNRLVSWTGTSRVVYGFPPFVWTRRLPEGFYDIAIAGQHTFGAALKRARAALTQE